MPLDRGQRDTSVIGVGMAQAAKRLACMQVLQLACDAMLFMPAFSNVRHLLVKQFDLNPVIRSLPCLPLLETLTLEAKEDVVYLRQGPEG